MILVVVCLTFCLIVVTILLGLALYKLDVKTIANTGLASELNVARHDAKLLAAQLKTARAEAAAKRWFW